MPDDFLAYLLGSNIKFKVSSNITSIPPYADYVRESDEWTIISYQVEEKNGDLVIFYENNSTNWTIYKVDITDGNYSNGVRIQLKLSRKSSYYVYNLIVPLLVIVSLGLSAIAIPSQTNQKPQLLLAILLAFTLYQLLLAESTPKTSTVPFLALYIICCLLISGVDIFIVCFILLLHNYGQKKVPKWICWIFLKPIRFCLNLMKLSFRWVKNKIIHRKSAVLVPGINFKFYMLNMSLIKKLFNYLLMNNRWY